MYFTNITGGEPFIRTDLRDIVRELYKKSDRIVISTNGFLQIALQNQQRNFHIQESVFQSKAWNRRIMKYVDWRMGIKEDIRL